MSVDPVSLGIKVALTAASIGLSMMNKIEGPRLDTLDVSLADYGTPIRRFWGIRRLEGLPIIWAKKLREEKVETKGKGGKYENYKYYGTWAVLIADQEISAVRRLWFDKHLVFQIKDVGPIGHVMPLADQALGPLRVPVKLSGLNMRTYLGTEDQLPDPSMVHWCEDRYGEDSCPAYRGCAYMVFHNIPLEKFGNRIPQVTAEAATAVETQYLKEEFAGQAPPSFTQLAGVTFSPDYTKMFCGAIDTYEVWDIPTRTKIYGGTVADGGTIPTATVGLYNDGSFLLCDDTTTGYLYTEGGTGKVLPSLFSSAQGSARVLRDTYGTEYLCTIPAGYYQTFTVGGQALIPYEATGYNWTPACFVSDSYGDIWAVGRLIGPFTTADKVFFWRVIKTSGRDTLDFGYTSMPSQPSPDVYAVHYDDGFVVCWGGDLYRIRDDDFTIEATNTTIGLGGYGLYNQFASHNPNDPILYAGLNSKIDLGTLEVDTFSLTGDFGLPAGSRPVYDPVNHALIGSPSAEPTLIFWAYLDRIDANGIPLQTIVDDVAEWCGITVDATDLDQTIYGYSVVQGSGKDMIAPLLDIHDSDCRPHDFTIQFVKRGNASGGTISDFVREGDEARYRVSIAQDTDLPRRLSINFADKGKDQQTNTVISQRPLDSVDGVREQSIDLTTYATTPAEAQQLSDRRFRRLWNERETIESSLTAQSLGLEPADVMTLSLDGTERNARLTKMTISQGRISCTWTRDALTLAGLNSSQGANMDGRDDDVIYVPGPAKGIILETPYLDDTEVNAAPLIHYAGGTYGESYNFPGVILYESDPDGTEFSEWNAVESVSRATWGYATGALSDCDPWCWDRGSSLSVNTFGRTLTSTTEAAIDADPTVNLAVVGSEIVNFVTATLEVDGTYTLTGFKRGRRGTEWACPDHVTGEVFVLASSLQEDGYSLSDVGTTRKFKAQMLGRDPTFAGVTEIELSGATLKPYAPARLKWVFDGTDLQGTITRRTRLGGSWVGGTTIPLSEASEAYEVDIYNGATLKRTITVSGTNTFTYTAAMAAADGISLPTLPTSYVYQMSDAVGRGYALAA